MNFHGQVTVKCNTKVYYITAILGVLTPSEKIVNHAARLIFKNSRRDHIISLILELHLLPVKYRIECKIAPFVLRHFENTLPPNVASFFISYEPCHCHPVTKGSFLFVPRTNPKYFG